MSSRLRWLCLLLLLTGGLLWAQPPAPVITAANVAALQTVARVDFAPAAGFSSGAFFMNAAGTHFAAPSRTALWRWQMDAAGTVTALPPVPLAGAWLVDAQYDANHGLVALLSVGPA
ncbi:MAG: hypothetical protein MUE40_02905, partial [Anaerolineae bacterium]|nr:hypothetical protein [Anaerolineae bacterium]